MFTCLVKIKALDLVQAMREKSQMYLKLNIKDMKIYKVTKESEISNTIVKELNASVLTTTFKNKGIQLADLCQSLNGSKDLVSKGHCIPVNSKIIDTVLIDL
jgi:hypothetical protein